MKTQGGSSKTLYERLGAKSLLSGTKWNMVATHIRNWTPAVVTATPGTNECANVT